MDIELILIRIFHYAALAGALVMIYSMVGFFRKRLKCDSLLEISQYEIKMLICFGLFLAAVVTFIWTL